MKKRHKRSLAIGVGLGAAALVVLLYLNKNPIVRFAYLHGYFDRAFSDAKMMSGYQPKVVSFDFSFQGTAFFDDLVEDGSQVARRGKAIKQKQQKANVNIEGENYPVDLMTFNNYFKEIKLNKRKSAFTIRFSPLNLMKNKIRQWDLFQINRVDFFQQELVVDLGRQLNLYIPKTEFVNVYRNYEDYGDYTFKQSYDDIFMEQNNLPGSIVFMLDSLESREGDKRIAIRYLSSGKKSRNRGIEKHLNHFLELLKRQDPNLLVKYFDLDYIGRFEVLRQLLNAGAGFVLEDNIRFIYNRFNGKLYPVLDESNIFNMQDQSRQKSFALLRKQIKNNPVVKQKRDVYLSRLGDRYRDIIANFKQLFKKYSSASDNLLYQIRIKLVAAYFRANVYSQLKRLGKKQKGHPESYSPVSQPRLYLDEMVLSARAFIEMNKNLDLELKGQKIILKAGEYTLKKTLIVPMGFLFEIAAGTTLKLAPGVSVVCYCPVIISGTADKPVIIKSLDPGNPFAVFAVQGDSTYDKCPVTFTHLDFSGASGGSGKKSAWIKGVKYDGGMNIYNADVEIKNSSFHQSSADAGLDVKGSIILLENNAFYSNFSDQLALDFCQGIVRSNRFSGGGGDPNGDGAAVKGSEIFFQSNRFENLQDKGISIAMDSEVVLYNNQFESNGTGAASRDQGQVLLLDNGFFHNQTAVSAYQKDEERGGGSVYLLTNTFENNSRLFKIDKFSTCFYLQNRMDGKEANALRSLISNDKIDDLFTVFSQMRARYRYKENPIKSLYVGETRAQIDEANNVIFVALPKGAPVIQPIRIVSTLADTDFYITPTAYGARSSDSIAATAREEKITDNRDYNFKEYIFRGQLSVRHDFQGDEYELVVSSGALPIVEIDTSDGGDVPRKIRNEPKISCQVRFVWSSDLTGVGYLNRFIDAKIEGRGQKWEKWKYGITLDEPIVPEGMKKSRRWVLESSYVEKSLMRSKIAFDLFDQFRDPKSMKRIAPRSQFVEVILNGDYHGVYLLMEHIDGNFLQLADFDKNEPYNALLYRARDKNANFTRYNSLESLYEKDYEDFPGGRQPLDKELDPIRGWSSGFEQRYPDIDEYGEHWQPIKEFSKFAARSTDVEFEQRIPEFLDIERYINLWVFIQLVDDSDGLYQNRYIAREKGEVKFYFIPWDKDGILGRDHKMNKRHHALWLHTPLFNRCMKHRWFREIFKNIWQDLRGKGVISEEKMLKMIDENAAVLEDAQKRNFKRWPTDPRRSPYPDANTFYQEIDYMKDWIHKRIRWLDDRIVTIHSIPDYMEAR
ncbi:MAG: hypothetical protein GTO45_14155 [Candidatus Aminicenantes bacterium]|nr:hypothetical protein [Candidatus Aminicenantes bacterium]NIM79909.1 hypothetical protein [Candidatus Aminicenantes bacterium]NIN19248.1 hypothetical protein [Candidatus Aminicenantes bacterium]NIN43151.1 hypothetical protein [Candidatus Aminicenantes bacterium]NIN85890.1 hypothetical protein [Candidatus Aminicenantes bacterium]